MSKTLAAIASELQYKAVLYSRKWSQTADGHGNGLSMSGLSMEGENAEDLCIEWLATEITRAKLIMDPLLVDTSPMPRLSTVVSTWRMLGPCVYTFIKMISFASPAQYFVETQVRGDQDGWNTMDVECYEMNQQKRMKRQSCARIDQQMQAGFYVPVFKVTELWSQ